MAVAATGFFDGVHLGHRQIIETTCSLAREEATESMVVSFWPHPRNVLQQDADTFRLLTSLDEKKDLCRDLGIDRFEVLPFSRDFSQMPTDRFVKEYLVDRFGVTSLVVGYDHRLGHDSFETREEMMDVIASCGVTPVPVDEFRTGERAVSSTAIRRALEEGRLKDAEQMLGYRYRLHGVVVAGDRIGRTIGFPTANMQLYDPLKLIPCNGVYVVEVEVLGRKQYGICNVGTRPTVSTGMVRGIEVNILDFNENIYGLEMKIWFVERLRDERKFASLDLLKEQLHIDKAKAINIIGK